MGPSKQRVAGASKKPVGKGIGKKIANPTDSVPSRTRGGIGYSPSKSVPSTCRIVPGSLPDISTPPRMQGKVSLLDSDDVEFASSSKILNVFFGGILFDSKHYIQHSATVRTARKTAKTSNVSNNQLIPNHSFVNRSL